MVNSAMSAVLAPTTSNSGTVTTSASNQRTAVDDVHEVESVDPEDVDDSAASETTRGVVRRDDRFVVWVDPDALV